MFGLVEKVNSLETTLKMYESVSKDMLEKLGVAVDKITNNITHSNQMMTNMLAKHDERIDNSVETQKEIILNIKELKTEINSEIKYFRNDLQILRQDLTTFKSDIVKDIDTKVNTSNENIVEKLRDVENRLDNRISKIEVNLNETSKPMYINQGKISIFTAIMILVGTAFFGAAVTYFFEDNNDNSNRIEYNFKKDLTSRSVEAKMIA